MTVKFLPPLLGFDGDATDLPFGDVMVSFCSFAPAGVVAMSWLP